MAKKILTPEQQAARKARSAARRAARKAARQAANEARLAPREKKERKPRTRKATDTPAVASDIVLFKNIESLMSFHFHRFASNDDRKMVYYMTKSPDGAVMNGALCTIGEDGRICEAETSKLEAISNLDGFIGFVKEEIKAGR